MDRHPTFADLQEELLAMTFHSRKFVTIKFTLHLFYRDPI
jgi:hypothetical protein